MKDKAAAAASNAGETVTKPASASAAPPKPVDDDPATNAESDDESIMRKGTGDSDDESIASGFTEMPPKKPAQPVAKVSSIFSLAEVCVE